MLPAVAATTDISYACSAVKNSPPENLLLFVMCIVVPYILNVYNTLEEEYTDFNIFYNGYKRTEQLRLRVCVLLTCYLFAIAEFFVLLCSNNYCKH